MKEGTDDIPHGIGIQVWSGGGIWEGYWKDGELHGRGRTIGSDGRYYIGEYLEGRYNGKGTLYWNGAEYTGQWDMYGFKGEGVINYMEGIKFKGRWDGFYDHNYKKNGYGTLYSADGQVIKQGKWKNDEYLGEE